MVVLENGRQEEEESHRGIDDALVDDVDVGQLFVHRSVEGDDDDDEDVREESEDSDGEEDDRHTGVRFDRIRRLVEGCRDWLLPHDCRPIINRYIVAVIY